jgi:hypothetical protein
LPPSIEKLWLGELRRAHAIINIINNTQPHLQKGLERRIHSSRSDVFMNRQDESE